MDQSDEKPRVKNLIGMLLMIFGLTIYAFIAAAIGNALAGLWVGLQILYYLVVGIIWILPAKKLLDWMAPKAPSNPD